MPGIAFVYPIAAGVISGIGSALINVAFVQAIIIAAVTGILAAVGTIVGSIVAARYSRRATDSIQEGVTHIKRAVEANRRVEDRQQEAEQDAVERARDNEGTDGTRT